MATTQQTIVKLARLPKFSGTIGENLEGFLVHMELRYADYGVTTDEQKVRLILKALKDEAFNWFTVYVQNFSNKAFIIGQWAQDTKVGVWKDFKEFITYLKNCHGRHDDPVEKAMQELYVIKQGRGSVMLLNQEFDRKLAIIGGIFSDDKL